MNRTKKAARMLVFVCLILLAGIGIGLSGGVPISSITNIRDTEKENIELIENEDVKSAAQAKT